MKNSVEFVEAPPPPLEKVVITLTPDTAAALGVLLGAVSAVDNATVGLSGVWNALDNNEDVPSHRYKVDTTGLSIRLTER